MKKPPLPLLIALLAVAAAAVQAQPSSCSSDAVPVPAALLERFISADCQQCWTDPQTPEAASGALALDWVTDGSKGEDAPLAAVATRDGQDRAEALGTQPPDRSTSRFSRRIGDWRGLRVAHGLPFNDYIAASIEFPRPPAGAGTAWLILVETLPAGTEGSPVERNLVRGAFTTRWQAGKSAPAKRYESRSMRLVEGTKVERLRVVGWLEDDQHRVRAMAQSRCRGG
jgi:hypothetical protein